MKEFIKILSNISGYSVKELTERNTDPIIQPEDCLEAMKKAINYTRCCKSDSEQFSFADMRSAYEFSSSDECRYDGMTFNEWMSKR